jgi:hypothetical protein
MMKTIKLFTLTLAFAICSMVNAQTRVKGVWCDQELSIKPISVYSKCLKQNPEIVLPEFPKYRLVSYSMILEGNHKRMEFDRNPREELNFEELMMVFKANPDFRSGRLTNFLFMSEDGDVMKWNGRMDFEILN